MFEMTEEWLFQNYGSTAPGQERQAREWLQRYGKDVREEELEEWAKWKHLAEYQVNTPKIIPLCLEMVGMEFKNVWEAHRIVNQMRVPGASTMYLSALKSVKPKTILELGVGGDSAISTAIFIAHLAKYADKFPVKLVSVDYHPLGMTWNRFKDCPYWVFLETDSVSLLKDRVQVGQKYDMVFIDTIHSFRQTLEEIALSSFITDAILLDDSFFEGNDFDEEPGGVKRAISEWSKDNQNWTLSDFGGVAMLKRDRRKKKGGKKKK